MKSYGLTIQMKPLQQCFHMVLFIWYVVLTFESVDEILWCDHSNETSSAVLSHGTIYLVCSSNFWVWTKSYGVALQVKPLQQYWLSYGTIQYATGSSCYFWQNCLQRTFLWCFPFSIHKFSKLNWGLFKTEFWFRTLKLIRLIRLICRLLGGLGMLHWKARLAYQ